MIKSLKDGFRLKLQVECHLNREPLFETIYVRSGMKVHELKDYVCEFFKITSDVKNDDH